MKRTLFLLFLGSVELGVFAQQVPVAPYLPAQAAPAQQEHAPITVQYPYENMKLPKGAEQIFIFGQVHVPGPAALEINGTPVELFKNGAFIAYLPVQTGPFAFVLTLQKDGQTYRAVRHITVQGTDLKDLTAKAAFDEAEVFPQRPVELLPGETLPLYARGTPGAQVSAHLPGLKNGKNVPLTEDKDHPGIYRASLSVLNTQKPKTTVVHYKMKGGPDKTKAKVTAPAKITVRSLKKPFTYAQINTPGTKIRKRPTETGNLYPDYRAYGILRVLGEKAGQYHLWLSPHETAWLEKNRLDEVKNEPIEPNILSFVRADATLQHTRLTFTLDRPVPIKIREYNDRLELALYNVDGFEQNFSLDDTSPVLQEVQWNQPAQHVFAFRLNLRSGARLWGYRYNFEGTQLVVDLVHTPDIKPNPAKPLASLRLVVDAGHSPKRTAPYDGAVGPTGYLEYEATLALAEELTLKLEKAGATVLLTRQGDNPMSLQDRYDFAREQNADLFISLHYNAVADTVNPLAKPRGFSVYYAYPHSETLARSVHQAYTKHVPLADNGLIQNDVLFIPRMPDYPSILVESAFLILPEQEELARTQEGRALFVKALYEGIVNFYNAQFVR